MLYTDPKQIRPLPAYYFSPSFRGAPVKPSDEGAALYKSRKMEGTLGGFFNMLLAGERASGTSLYAARKAMGFDEIEWIEKAEPGTYGYRRISPSEALGIKGYADKFWTVRGITSLAIDIALDPTTYIGIGLAGRVATIGGKGVLKSGGIRVGKRGAEFLAETEARGISRATAERKLIEYMGRDPKVQAEMMERGGARSLKFMGQPLMKTARVTEPAGRLWQVTPMLETRTQILETARTAFVPFHQLKQRVGAWAVKPFEEYYRKTGVGRSQWDKYVYGVSKGVPEEWHDPIVRYAELGEVPATNIAEITRLGEIYRAETSRMAEREVARGILEPEAVKSLYYARFPTEEAMRYVEKEMGKDFGVGLTREKKVSKYIHDLHAARERVIKEDIFVAEDIMRKATGVKQWYVFDPFESLQRRGVASIMSLESAGLKESIIGMGFRAVVDTAAKFKPLQIRAKTWELAKTVAEEERIYTERAAKLHPTLAKRILEAAEAERALAEFPARMEVLTTEVAPMFPKSTIGRQLLKKGERLQQQQYAIQSLRQLVSASGDVEKINLPYVLRQLKTKQVFGEVRPAGETPWTWIRKRFEEPITEHHRYKQEIWQLEKDMFPIERAISHELRRPIISRADLMGFERSIELTHRGIRHREKMIDQIGLKLRAEGRFVGTELIDPAERAILKYRKAYETEIEKTIYAPFGVGKAINPIEFRKFAKERTALESGVSKTESAISKIEQQLSNVEFARYKWERGIHAREATLERKLATRKALPIEKYKTEDGVSYELKGGYYIPTAAIAEYQRRIPASTWWTRQETKFKKTLTSIWPAFHARNLYGILGWQNILAGVGARGYLTNLEVMASTSPMIQKYAAKYAPSLRADPEKLFDIPFIGKKTATQMRDIAEEWEAYGITGMIDVAATYTTKGKGITRMLSRAYEQVPQELMVGVESVGRGALFWDRVMKGIPVEKAAKDVEKFHFRYGQGALTQFESEKMRHIFLFYRWMRGNIPLQAQMSLEKPGLYAGLGKVYERSMSPEARARLKPWQQERFGFNVGNTFVSLDLPFYEHPMMYFDPDQWGNIGFALSPAIKYPVGMVFGRDPATGVPITTWKERGEFTTSQFGGRFMYAQKELSRTLAGERPVSWTVAHQFGGVGVYEMSPVSTYAGMSTMPRVPGDLKKLGVTQDVWTEWKLAGGWTPSLTDEARMDIHQQHGGRCSVCGQPCSPSHPCRSQLIVPVELGGKNTPDNTILVHDTCAGSFRRNVAPLRAAQMEHLEVPKEYSFADKNRLWGVMDEWAANAEYVE